MPVATPLRCPVCSADLLHTANSYRCANNHGFDVARQGYVNLLLSSQRPSKAPGDSAEMIADRHAFLEAGFYAPLRDRIVALLDRQLIAADRRPRVLDLGCGEGYYTAACVADGQRDVYGLDIAKPALASAARRSDRITWIVGTSRALPFHDHALDAVLNIFCRPHWREIRRVLHDDGVLLYAGPGPDHLRELRAVLYEEVSVHADATLETARQHGFEPIGSDTLAFELSLPADALGRLARMTPHYWRAPAERRTQLEQLPSLTVRAEFAIHLLQAR